jgi:hypothetical protein
MSGGEKVRKCRVGVFVARLFDNFDSHRPKCASDRVQLRQAACACVEKIAEALMPVQQNGCGRESMWGKFSVQSCRQ